MVAQRKANSLKKLTRPSDLENWGGPRPRSVWARVELEMNKNLVYLFAVAFVVAIIATGIFYGLFIGQFRQNGGPAGAGSVLVAKRNLDRGTVLQPDDVKAVAPAAGQPVVGGFSNPSDIAGATVLEPIQENEPVLQARVTPVNSAAAGAAVPKGMRAVSVHVSESGGVIAMLRSGQKVDVQVVGGGPETQLRTVLQNVEVLNVPGPENGRPVVNLVVKPEEADLLSLADSVARVRLILRNPKDDAQNSLGGVVASAVFRGPAGSR
jgi:pilus assembly protein CpaB